MSIFLTQQSEEILILKQQRQKEFSGMRPAKLREESSILKNIQRREMVDKVLNFSKVGIMSSSAFFGMGLSQANKPGLKTLAQKPDSTSPGPTHEFVTNNS